MSKVVTKEWLKFYCCAFLLRLAYDMRYDSIRQFVLPSRFNTNINKHDILVLFY